MKNITVRQFTGQATNRYRARYRKVLGLPVSEYPEYAIPYADHPFMVGPYLISRPYQRAGDEIREILDWCDEYDFNCSFDAPSSWYPQTLLIIVSRRDWAVEFWRDAEGKGDAFELGVKLAFERDAYSTLHTLRGRKVFGYPSDTGLYVLDNLNSRHARNHAEFGALDIDDYLKPSEGFAFYPES